MLVSVMPCTAARPRKAANCNQKAGVMKAIGREASSAAVSKCLPCIISPALTRTPSGEKIALFSLPSSNAAERRFR